MVSACCNRIAKSCFPTSLFTPGLKRNIAVSGYVASAAGWASHLLLNHHVLKRNIFTPQNAGILAFGVVTLLADRLILSLLNPKKPLLSLSQRIAEFHRELQNSSDEKIFNNLFACKKTLAALEEQFGRLSSKGTKESDLLAKIKARLASAPSISIRINSFFKELTTGNTKLPANVLKNYSKYMQKASQLEAEMRAMAVKNPRDEALLNQIKNILEFHKMKPASAPKKPNCCTSFFRNFWSTKNKFKMDAWTREHRPSCYSLKGALKKEQRGLKKAAEADAKDQKRNRVDFFTSRAAAESAVKSTRSLQPSDDGKRKIGYSISAITTQDCPVCPMKEKFQFAAATHMGSKEGKKGKYYNEDKIFAHRDWITLGKLKYPFRMWGICDGHEGDEAAKFVKKNIVSIFVKNLKAEAKKCCSYKKLTNLEINNAITKTTVELNDKFYDLGLISGTTLNFSVAINHTLFNGNVGDTKTILVRDGKLTPMSRDHKPKDEKASLEARGGAYDPVNNRASALSSETNRYWGKLGPGRTIGDIEMDRRISSRASVTSIPANQIPEGSIVMTASDGAFDYAPSSVYSNGLWQSAKNYLKDSAYFNGVKEGKNFLQDLVYQVVGSAVVGQFKATEEQAESRCDNTSAIILRMPKYDPKDYNPQPA